MAGEPRAPGGLDGFARNPMVPELLVGDLAASLHFWCDLCGFRIAYDRPEDAFAYLDRAGVQVMLEQEIMPGRRRWITGELQRPLGRGVSLQIAVNEVAPILAALTRAGWPLYLPLEEVWYRAGEGEIGVRQFLVQDPNGYLLRFQQLVGSRAAHTHAICVGAGGPTQLVLSPCVGPSAR